MSLLLLAQTLSCLAHLAGEQGGGGAGGAGGARQWRQTNLEEGGDQLEQPGEHCGLTSVSPAIKPDSDTSVSGKSGKLTSWVIKLHLPSGIHSIQYLQSTSIN